MKPAEYVVGVNTTAPGVVVARSSGTAAPAVTPSAASASSLVMSSAPCGVDFIQVCSSGTALWIMLINAAVVPSNGAVTPVLVWQLPPGSNLVQGFDPPLAMSSGAILVASTTGPTTLTLSATAWFGGRIF